MAGAAVSSPGECAGPNASARHPGRGEAVVEADLRAEPGPGQRPDLVAGRVLRFSMAVLDGVELVTGHDHVPRGREVRLQVLDWRACLGVAEGELQL